MAVLVVTVSACSAPDGSSGGDSDGLLCSLQYIWKAQHWMAVLSVPVSAFGVFCSTSGAVVGQAATSGSAKG